MTEFLQSKEWEQFQQSLGRATVRFSDGTLGIVMPLPLGQRYMYIPRARAAWETIRSEVFAAAKSARALCIRLEPVFEIPSGFLKITNTQPAHTVVLDLTKTEEELLAGMHQKTRYNIRLAEKRRVECREKADRSQEGLDIFWKLIGSTYGRKGKKTYAKEYYEKLLRVPGMKLYVARVDGKPAAANFVLWSGDTATYLHGGSDESLQATMAPQSLQWFQIKEAQKAGLRLYDLWGIDKKYGEGIARFKKGFGGFEVQYPGTFEMPVKKVRYTLLKIARKLLK